MTDKPIMRDHWKMHSEDAKTMSTAHYVNATTKEIDDIKWKLMDSIHFNFNERECNILYRLAAFDLLTSSDCKSAIMIMAQKLGNIAIPKEEDE